MVSKTKLYDKLDLLEAQLQKDMIDHLTQAIKHEDEFIFCVSTFSSRRWLKKHSNKKMEQSVTMGAHILTLKEKLNETVTGSIAERVCWYCREWNRTHDENTPMGVFLAKQFLTEIEGL